MLKIAKYSICILIILAFMVSTLTAYGYLAAWNPYQDNQEKIEKEEKEASEIKELRIKNSGFRSHSSIVIRYRDKDKKIVAVFENGKELPASEFGRYESVVHEVLEIPRINKLLPEMDEMWRELESSEFPDAKKRELTRELMRDLQAMKSERALRYQEQAAAQFLDGYYRAIEKLSRSKDMAQPEKIKELRLAFQSLLEAGKFRDQNKERSAALAEYQAAEAARRLMSEINKSSEISQEEKFRELKEVFKQMQHMEQGRTQDRRRSEIAAIELYNAVKQRWEEIEQDQKLSDKEKRQQYEHLLQEFNDVKSDSLHRMMGIEKFKLDLNQLLEKEGRLPTGEAEFVLRKGECTINGKKLPKDLHEKIMQLCQESIGKNFTKDTKIILQLNKKR